MISEYTTKLISKANNFIEKNRETVNAEFKPNYHMSPPIGWMNDPNGLVYFGGKFHLFYQFTPFNASPKVMLWGHFVSEDLVNFKDMGVALAPDDEYSSIFSGGAIDVDGTLNLIYTKHSVKDGRQTEIICRATSTDGVKFDYCGSIFDNDDLPENFSRVDFRDPYPVKHGDKFYVFVGGKDLKSDSGVIIVLVGDTLAKLEYKFSIGELYELGTMGECPSYCKLGEKDLIVASGCNVKSRENSFKNINSSVFILGDLDFERGSFKIDSVREIDKGDTFYAPQIVNNGSQPIMIGWLEMWNKSYPTAELGHGWVGAFSVARELKLVDGIIVQLPVKNLENYLKPSVGCPKCADINFDFCGCGLVEIIGSNGSISVENGETVSLDSTHSNNMNVCVRRTDGHYECCNIRILLDKSTIEVFVDGGRESISSRMYLNGDLKLALTGKVVNLSIKEVGVVQ